MKIKLGKSIKSCIIYNLDNIDFQLKGRLDFKSANHLKSQLWNKLYFLIWDRLHKDLNNESL
jgi:hypothetical protein